MAALATSASASASYRSRPADTNPAVLMANARPALPIAERIAGGMGKIRVARVIVCNTTGVPQTYRIMWDPLGATFNEATAQCWDRAILANDTHILELGLETQELTAVLQVRSSAANALTFTATVETV